MKFLKKRGYTGTVRKIVSDDKAIRGAVDGAAVDFLPGLAELAVPVDLVLVDLVQDRNGIRRRQGRLLQSLQEER